MTDLTDLFQTTTNTLTHKTVFYNFVRSLRCTAAGEYKKDNYSCSTNSESGLGRLRRKIERRWKRRERGRNGKKKVEDKREKEERISRIVWS